MATAEDFARIGNYAVMYNPDRNIDRTKCTRTVPMEVLCLDMSRTGTLSMHAALRTLGVPSPYHFSELYANAQDCDMWLSAFRAKYDGIGTFGRTQWDQLLGHCGAVTDMPANVFAVELAEAYPDAKIVLVERELGKWEKSIDTLFAASMNPVFWAIAQLDYKYTRKVNEVGYTTWKYQFQADTLKGLRNNARRAYKEHYAKIRGLIPKERILEYRLGSGWEPLCEFLGKPVPKEPFPHLNEGSNLEDVFKSNGKVALLRALGNIVFWTGIIAAPVIGHLWATRYGAYSSLTDLFS